MILYWKAGAGADSSHAPAVGYCVYRGLKRKDPSRELANSISFPGTSFTDDLVESGRKYYVVQPISAHEIAGITSSEGLAAIPKHSKSSVPEASAPLCREPPSVKWL